MEFGHVRGTETGNDLQTHQVANPSESNGHVSHHPSSSSASSFSSMEIGTNAAGGGEQPDASPQQATPHRIPSYVFARDKSLAQAEWSVASNESLFSIHMGNMSFTRDMSWMSKSGDLGYTIESTMSSPMIELPSSCQATPSRNSSEVAKKGGDLNEAGGGAYGVTEAAAAETMREVLREKESQGNENVAKGLAHSRSLSDPHSDGSVKSFAFPILTGEDRNNSFKPNSKHKKNPSRPTTPKAGMTPPETPKQRTPTASETGKQETPKSEMAKDNQNGAGPKKWFSCFYCCTGTSCTS